jgi:hypothetical protein
VVFKDKGCGGVGFGKGNRAETLGLKAKREAANSGKKIKARQFHL